MALHIAYSNSYDVLKAQLTVNLRTDSKSGTNLLFSPIQIVVPSREIENDIARRLCRADGICIGLSFSNLAGWLKPYGSFWHTSSIDNFTLPWSLYPILTRIQRENDVHSDYGRLLEHLKGMTPGELFSLAEHIAHVFTKYVNYRYDWVCSWLGDSEATRDTRELDKQPDLLWQKRLWQELRGRDRAQEQTGSSYTTASYTGKILELQEQLLGDCAEGRTTENQATPVHIFLPHKNAMCGSMSLIPAAATGSTRVTPFPGNYFVGRKMPAWPSKTDSSEKTPGVSAPLSTGSGNTLRTKACPRANSLKTTSRAANET